MFGDDSRTVLTEVLGGNMKKRYLFAYRNYKFY